MTRLQDNITGIILIKGTLENLTRLVIGSGEDELANIMTIIDESGKPMIPASSFMGPMKRQLKKDLYGKVNPEMNNKLAYLLGGDEDIESQSHIRIDNITCRSNQIKIYQSIEIDPAKNISETGLRDYQAVDPNQQWDFGLEITIREAFRSDAILEIVKHWMEILEEGIHVGAFQKLDFGKLKLIDYKTAYFKFKPHGNDEKTTEVDLDKNIGRYRRFLEEGDQDIFYDYKFGGVRSYEIIKDPTLFINAEFRIKNNILIAEDTEDKNIDSRHLRTADDHKLLSASSIRGALRHRSIRILKTLKEDSDQIIRSLYGYVDDSIQKTAKRSRIKVSDYIIPKGINKDKLQTRVSIDALTGGSLSSALFTAEVLEGKPEFYVHIVVEAIHPTTKDHDLMMNCFKDLFFEDMAIGGEKNIGRGILTGSQIEVKYHNGKESFEYKANKDGLVNGEDYKKLINKMSA